MNKRITFAVKGVIIRDNKILIVKKSHPDHNFWEIPGGHLDYGETADKTIIREIREETGLTVLDSKLMDTWNNIMPDWQITGVIMLCDCEDQPVSLSEEHTEYRWISPKNQVDLQILHPEFFNRLKAWDWDNILKN